MNRLPSMMNADDCQSRESALERQTVAWALECFGVDQTKNLSERNCRFLEEAIELVQSCDFDRGAAHRIVDYVYDRPSGEIGQEVGGVVLSLILLCSARNIRPISETERELARVEQEVAEIRKKQNQKPHF